ncbi:PREDICTED: crocetin glucosyltransferase, chloroplastic [Theobroma cacao]|uniref:Crocetin glucosyltransferase, chloroplastic n=1 Tax=Theobroma cacao TaxID=3641 RepID=A0AB32VW16_THECC|nr:PREDICTED: crocetin glucosyltransferase, chloroplastic [Theobroma cacao]
MSSDDPHFLLVTLPGQGHLNPTLQLAKRLIQAGARVTFATTTSGQRKIKSFPSLEGLAYAFFSDGFDDGTSPSDKQEDIMSKLEHIGSQTLTNLLLSLSGEGHPVSFLIYSLLLSWVADVARDLSIPSALLCNHSGAAFAIYHHYLNSQTGAYDSKINCPPSFINFEGLPPFKWKDLPSFLLPYSPHSFVTTNFQKHIRVLEKDPNPCVLINTFDELEEYAIKTLAHDSNINLITIGPLVPSDKFVGCDLFENSSHDYYTHWLDSKPDCSVVYISFGSLAVLPRNQMEEIFHGIVDSGYTFLWVIRPSKDGEEEEGFENAIKDKIKEEQGLIVPWCSQVEVLNHRAVGCFVTHCGWNSTTECLVAGVPMVALPQFSDQTTNAKLVDEVWETGIRIKVNEGTAVAEKEEIRRCLEMVMGNGQKGEAMRGKAKKWRGLALEATSQGGSSANNFKVFMESFVK